jgi:hypothetical protein
MIMIHYLIKIFENSGYFTNPIPTDNFLNPISRVNSIDSNKTIK